MLDLDRVTLEDILNYERPKWHRDALCREHPELNWFPGKGEQIDEQRAVCARCSVREPECLSAALDGRELGVWAGTSGRERRLMIRVTAA